MDSDSEFQQELKRSDMDATTESVKSLFSADRTALLVLFFLSFVYFLENFDRSLISVAPIPYIDYGSYEYSVLAGPAFTIIYTFGGVIFALASFTSRGSDSSNSGRAVSMSKFNILSATTLVFSVSFACTAFALYFWQQVLVRIVMGLAQSLITPFSTSIISDYFPAEVRGAAFGVFNLGTYLSFSLALSLGIYIYVTYGWQAGYLLFGVIGVLCAVLMPLFACTLKQPPAILKESISHEKNQENEEDVKNQGYISEPIRSLMHSVEARDLSSSTYDDTASEATSDRPALNLYEKIKLRVQDMSKLAYDICFRKWYNSSGIFLLCLATGVRLGAGYIWVSYTGAFYSDLFETDEDSSCDYSFSANYAALPDNVCGSDYPYCVDGSCSALTSFPWHNKVSAHYLNHIKLLVT